MEIHNNISCLPQGVTGRKAYSKSRVREVHTKEDCVSDIVHVDKVAPPKTPHESSLEIGRYLGLLPDEPDGDEMVADKLVVVLPWLLETENKNKELLSPEGGLHKIIPLELWLYLPVRVT